jgi:probable HAF family extracellular repeat protein
MGAAHATHAFLSGPGGMPLQDLGTLPGFPDSFGNAVNAFGQVVGTLITAGGEITHAFLYSNGRMTDLNDLIPAGSGFTFLASASGINDAGQITGTGTTSSGATQAFLLTPVPEPPGLVLLGIGTGGLLGYSWWRRRAATA